MTAYTQTLSDIKAHVSSTAKANQMVGNFNNLVMLRVREKNTAMLLIDQLPDVDVYQKTLTSGVTYVSRPGKKTDINSNVNDQVILIKVPMISRLTDIINLPKGQAYALLEGGRLWKIRMPLPADNDDPHMPASLEKLADNMEKNYHTKETWWTGGDMTFVGGVSHHNGDYDRRQRTGTSEQRAGPFGLLLWDLPISLIGILLGSLLASLLIEYVCIALLWTDEGAA